MNKIYRTIQKLCWVILLANIVTTAMIAIHVFYG